jgi:hypothetical protein
VPGAFGQPDLGPVDLGADIGAGYQQNAANKIGQARVKARKDYTSGFAKKYGVTDVVKATKGLSDTDIYELATKLVTKRRGPKVVTTPKPAPKATAPKVTAKPAAKAAPKAPAKAAPRVTAKTPAKKPATRTRTAAERRRLAAMRKRRLAARTRSTTTRRTAPAPTISATKIAAISRATI